MSATTTAPSIRSSRRATTTGETSTRSANRALTVFIALAVVAAAGFGGHYVLHRRSVELAQASSDRAAAATYLAEARLGATVRAHLGSYEARLAAGEALLPTGKNQSELISDLAALASSTGVSWSSGSQQQAAPTSVPGPSGGITPYVMSVSVTGSAHQVLAFVSGVSRMSRGATASGLQLTWQTPTSVQANLTVIAWSTGGAGSRSAP